MKTSQNVIILVGSEDYLRRTVEIVKDFKAVTAVTTLTEDIVRNVHRHNKNVVFATKTYDVSFFKFTPVIVNVSTNTNVDTMSLDVNRIMEDFPLLMESKNIDVGDHLSQDSIHSCSNHSCLLCKIAKRENEKPEHILYESDNFYVVPGLGAFFDGYCMIVPKAHVMSIAELDTSLFNEFIQVMNDWRFILESVYQKKIFIFENGSGKEGGGKNATSIVHSHVHLVPSDMPIRQHVHLHSAVIEPEELSLYGNYPYILYIDQEDNWFIISDPSSYFPRQYTRQLIADYMGLPPGAYDWRTNPLREKMDVIADKIQTFLRENFDSLPIWIQKNVKHLL